jgi:uncharacterized protein (DUF2147 family)
LPKAERALKRSGAVREATMNRVAITLGLSTLSLLASGLLVSFRAGAEEPTSSEAPDGYWRTIDDNTHKPKSVVHVFQQDGRLLGEVEKVLQSDHGPNPLCVKCPGELKDKPVVGMRIMWDLVGKGREWSSGRIIDPEKGKTYNCSVELLDGGKRLKVRGYIGVALFGRTQYWDRVEKPE